MDVFPALPDSPEKLRILPLEQLTSLYCVILKLLLLTFLVLFELFLVNAVSFGMGLYQIVTSLVDPIPLSL